MVGAVGKMSKVPGSISVLPRFKHLCDHIFRKRWIIPPRSLNEYQRSAMNKRLIKPLLVVRVGPGTNPKYGSHWTESLIAT